jgi:hypothetical protein
VRSHQQSDLALRHDTQINRVKAGGYGDSQTPVTPPNHFEYRLALAPRPGQASVNAAWRLTCPPLASAVPPRPASHDCQGTCAAQEPGVIDPPREPDL